MSAALASLAAAAPGGHAYAILGDMLELGSGELVVRIAKDRRGRIGLVRTVPFVPVLRTAV